MVAEMGNDVGVGEGVADTVDDAGSGNGVGADAEDNALWKEGRQSGGYNETRIG